MSFYKEFQQIRIYTGWKVTHNTFTKDVDQLTDEDLELQYRSSYDVIDFYSESRNLSISVDWIYKDGKGYYLLEVFQVLEVFNPKTNSQELKFKDEPRETYTIATTPELIEKVEELLWFVDSYQDPRILKNRGEVDEPSESYRIALEKEGLTQELIDKILADGNKQIQHITLRHKDLNREIIIRFLEESRFVKMQKRASELLKNKKYQ